MPFLRNRSESNHEPGGTVFGSKTASIVVLLLLCALSACVFLFRDRISQYAALGYPAIFLVCLVLNCGVFGLSPSGLVAVEMSYVYDPIIVPLVAGIGAGLGEAVSYFAGTKTTDLAQVKHADKFETWGNVRIGAVSFIASFISGNLSDAIGLTCGRLRKGFFGFITGATLAKIIKMYFLVFATEHLLDHFGTKL